MSEATQPQQAFTKLPEKIERRLSYMGFLPIEKPPQALPPILDITKATDNELGQLFSLNTAWYSYAANQLSLAKVDEMAERHLLDRALTEAQIKAPGKTITEKKSKADMDETVQRHKLKLMESKSYTLVLESHVDALDKQLSLISREITRRGRSDSWENREHTIQHVRS